MTTANRWYHDYVFSQSGILEIDAELPEGYVKGDVHTFAIARGKAGERISLVRSMLTENEHRWLIFLLVREFSMSELGASLWPELCRTQQIARCEKQAEIVLKSSPTHILRPKRRRLMHLQARRFLSARKLRLTICDIKSKITQNRISTLKPPLSGFFFARKSLCQSNAEMSCSLRGIGPCVSR